MNEGIKILLGEHKNVDAINENNFQKIFLEEDVSLLPMGDIKENVNAAKVFEEERENYQQYRIYGTIDYLSLLNNIPLDYANIDDFFKKHKTLSSENKKNIYNSFKFYLVRPSEGFIEIEEGFYHRKFKICSTPNDFYLDKASFSKNIFEEDKYFFYIDVDIDIKNIKDGLNFPLTKLYLYCEYQPQDNEEVFFTKFSKDSEDFIKTPISLDFESEREVGEVLFDENSSENITDIIEYLPKQYQQIKIENQTFKIKTPTNQETLFWEYNPFVPIRLRYLSSTLSRVDLNSEAYEAQESIPEYANILDNNTIVWREILLDGHVDPINNNTINPPFLNQKKYLFNTLLLSIHPDFKHTETDQVFNNILFDENNIISYEPINDNIENIGKPCQ